DLAFCLSSRRRHTSSKRDWSSDVCSSDLVVLTLTDTAGTDLEDAKVGVAIEQGSNVLVKGDKVALIRNTGGVDTSGVTQTTLTGYQGISLKYDFTLENDNGDDLTDSSGNENLYAVVGKAPDPGSPGSPVQVQDQTKAPVEGRVAGLALLAQGGELVSGAGMARAVQSAAGGKGVFGVLNGGHSKYDTGSHIKLDSVHLMLGA